MGIAPASVFRETDIEEYLSKPTRVDRIQLMQSGARELNFWLRDLFAQGLAALLSENKFGLDALAVRMVDTKNSSWARTLRLLSDSLDQCEWKEKVALYSLLGLYVQAKSVLNLEKLEPLLQTEVLATAGMNWRKKDLGKVIPVNDEWKCLHAKVEWMENLRLLSSDFVGVKSGFYATVNQYSFRFEPFDLQVQTGDLWYGDLIYYPSPTPVLAFPGEVFVKKSLKSKEAIPLPIEKMTYDLMRSREINPFRTHWPITLRSATLQKSHIPILDPATGEETERMKQLIQFSEADPNLHIFGYWSLQGFSPLSLISGGELTGLPAEDSKKQGI